MAALNVSEYFISDQNGFLLANFSESNHYNYTIPDVGHSVSDYPDEPGKFYTKLQSDGSGIIMNDHKDETSPCGVPTFSFEGGTLDPDTGDSVTVLTIDAATGTEATLRMSPQLNVNVQISSTTSSNLIFRLFAPVKIEFDGV